MERISYTDIPEGLFKNLRAIEDLISNSPLENKLYELIKLRISQKNGCAYCVDMHYKELKHAGETELRLSSLCVWEETPYFSDKERIVLKFAETLTKINNSPIPEEVYTPLLAHFNKTEICYLSLAITQINTWNRLMKVFLFTPGNYKVGDH
ncbi:carboxymuconolactone decarboxylase family protein [Flavivirga amylovorans]|uniref:Carboxymuconolactone decarboxylase family protein n=1 Tax=Flavivirga amylovorans TaxID=870486 RepID=A0ABT8WXR3_9FLAO|nr:carboxymuconolactone decarboxylase family protein [Flavivirga amylovorans]MDO5986475.1 carboxymuconolactone decarboxylase family protein [Flavivirga amylovorans]